MFKCTLFILTLFFCELSHADCFANAAHYQGINEHLLRAIAKVESDYNPEALHPKSKALGVMQILPSNFPSLRKFNINEADLHNPCINVHAGAWILAGFIKQYGPIWRAVGAYGAGNGKSAKVESQRVVYVIKIQKALKKLYPNTQNTQQQTNILQVPHPILTVNNTPPTTTPSNRPSMVVLE